MAVDLRLESYRLTESVNVVSDVADIQTANGSSCDRLFPPVRWLSTDRGGRTLDLLLISNLGVLQQSAITLSYIDPTNCSTPCFFCCLFHGILFCLGLGK